VVTGLATDTRDLRGGEVFLALKGERFDGHDFTGQALAAGAVAAVVSTVSPEHAGTLLLVPDTLHALGDIARAWRVTAPAKVAAITGSAGKTTTKGMLQGICALAGPTVAAEGTENNEIGVPKTLLRLEPSDQFCVLEFGMRGRGEIRQLAEIARPQVGVITTIGEAHIGRLGSREAIAESKAEMLPLLPPDGAAVLPADDFFFPLLSSLCDCRVRSFGFGSTAEVRALEVRAETLNSIMAVVAVEDETFELVVPLPGRHNLANALAAVAAGLALGCTLEQIRDGIESYVGMEMRGELLAGPAGCTIINDAYNANPQSVAAALRVLAQTTGRRIFVFGDMLELGEAGLAAHAAVGRQAAQTGVVLLITVGELAALAATTARDAGLEAVCVDTPEAAADALRPVLREGDKVLVKASRGLALERTVRRLLDGS
jgi:UDP-N-acetylmuramoyl-tripeptide--D-alanyl-D-alanine ligase